MDVLIAVGILALFVLFGAYVWTDLGDHMAEQERLDELWNDPLSEQEWDRQYDEAMQWRDWQTCDYLIEMRERSGWYLPDEVGVGGSVRSSSSVSRGRPTDTSNPRVTVYARTGPKDAA